MHSKTIWRQAPRPNYTTNLDLIFPYSETPFLGQYNLVKIPLSLNELVPHVDYWGEGKIVTQQGTSGFPNCYNVNHEYQLVSNGADRDKKIPNRIPVISYTNCDTSAYIRHNSVVLVTVMGAPINSSCAADIARIVNNDLGRVIVYGFSSNSKDIENLTSKLEDKSLFYCPRFTLPSVLQGVTLFDSHMAFLNVTMLKDELYKLIRNGAYDDAVSVTKKLATEVNGETIRELVVKLLNGNSSDNFKLMSFAYKLWKDGADDVVRTYFPEPFKLILGQEHVTIVNKGYDQALKLDANTDRYNDRLAWGHNGDKKSSRVSWQFFPVWTNNDVTFKLYNIDCNMYMKLDVTPDNIGDRQAWGSKDSSEDRHLYYVEPYMRNGTLVFFIINYKYHQGLKLAVDVDRYGDRQLFGHNGDIYAGEERFKWVISAW